MARDRERPPVPGKSLAQTYVHCPRCRRDLPSRTPAEHAPITFDPVNLSKISTRSVAGIRWLPGDSSLLTTPPRALGRSRSNLKRLLKLAISLAHFLCFLLID